RVGGEIGAGAGVLAGLAAADGHAGGIGRLRIGDQEFGERRAVAEVLEPELLLPARLPPGEDLPLLQRQVLRLGQRCQLRLGPAAGRTRRGPLTGCHDTSWRDTRLLTDSQRL